VRISDGHRLAYDGATNGHSYRRWHSPTHLTSLTVLLPNPHGLCWSALQVMNTWQGTPSTTTSTDYCSLPGDPIALHAKTPRPAMGTTSWPEREQRLHVVPDHRLRLLTVVDPPFSEGHLERPRALSDLNWASQRACRKLGPTPRVGPSNVMRVTRKAAPRGSDPRIPHTPLCRVDALVLRDHGPRSNHDHVTVRSRPRVLKRHMPSGSISRRGPVPTQGRAELAMPLASDSDPASRRPLAQREQDATGGAARKWRIAHGVRQTHRWTRSTSVRLHVATPDPSPSVSPMDARCPQALTGGESRPAKHPVVHPGMTEESQAAPHEPSLPEPHDSRSILPDA